MPEPPLELLNEVERSTLDAYCRLLRERLGERLLAVQVLGVELALP